MVSFSTLNKKLFQIKKIINKNLLLTNTVSCMVLLVVGDGVTQFIENKADLAASIATNSLVDTKLINNKLTNLNTTNQLNDAKVLNLDWTRSVKMLIMGTALGPITHSWYTFLDGKFPKKTKSIILRKLFLDQLIAAPLFNLTLIIGLHILNRENIKDLKKKFDDKFLTLYAYDCALWIPAQAINFSFVSPKYRVLYVNVATLFWNTISSYVLFNDTEMELNPILSPI